MRQIHFKNHLNMQHITQHPKQAATNIMNTIDSTNMALCPAVSHDSYGLKTHLKLSEKAIGSSLNGNNYSQSDQDGYGCVEKYCTA